jgi:nitroreductase
MTTSSPAEQGALIEQVIRERRTIGAFKPDSVPIATVQRAIEAATWAPNHRKTEPWRFYSLGPTSQQAIINLLIETLTAAKGAEAATAKANKWRGVPGWLVVTSRVPAAEVTGRERLVQTQEDYASVCCAIQNFSLVMSAQGLGTKWSTGDVTSHPEFLPRLGIDPQQETFVGLIWYGYPAVVPQQTRRPVHEVLFDRP